MTQDNATESIARTLAAVTADTARTLAAFTSETFQGLTQSNGELKLGLALLKQSVDAMLADARETDGDHETRIRNLENSDRKWTAVSIVASVVVSAIMIVVAKLLWS